jgi:deoxycytidylate deaminase
MSKTNLDQLYSLRRDFTIIGLTGRIGSGCSEIGKILSSEYEEMELIQPTQHEGFLKYKKKEIVQDFCKKNWKVYKIIEYKKVLFFLLLPDLLRNPKNTLLYDYFRFRLAEPSDENKIKNLKVQIQHLIRKNRVLVEDISKINIFKKHSHSPTELKKLGCLFWDEQFNELSNEVNRLLFENGVIERKMLLHHISNNYRASGDPFNSINPDSKNIFQIARAINKIIKATKIYGEGKCHIVIDSLKNSLEINFFKERYSAFYLVAVKNDDRHNQISSKYKTSDQEIIDRLIKIDDDEYKNTDYVKGIFYVPDLQNCIQISDYHINIRNEINIQLNKEKETFYTLNEQISKLQALIQQPNLITPEPIERVMQIAFTARLNSGCISRQVGAAITDKNYSIKAIGWNDTPKGSMPCSLRNVKEINSSNFGFSDFERGKGLKETEQTSSEIINPIYDPESKKFNEYVSNFYNEENFPDDELNGRNCPFCFKTAYNMFKGERNQVHTRSLHAEENAMLQISKFGGQALEGGFLFTTASTCELCAKKAYQLGIDKIYYIDPYPGISRNHILKSNDETDPKLILFSGAVGKAYLKFYEPFMSQKDELLMITGQKLIEPDDITQEKIKEIFKGTVLDERKIRGIIDRYGSSSIERIAELIVRDLNANNNE